MRKIKQFALFSLVLTGAAGLAGGLVLMPKGAVLNAIVPPGGERVLALSGLRIDEVRISGQRFTSDSAIFDCLDLSTASSLPGFDSVAAAHRIERLPWIESATITRVFPGRLDVAVTERTPYAVWLAGPAHAKLVDRSGRVLQAVPMSQLPALPRIAGEGAPEAAPMLFDMLARAPDVGGRVQMATRVTSRRWALDLTDGVRLELPPEGEEGVLAELSAGAQGRRLLAGPNVVIDLRSRREIAVRPREETSREP